MKDCSATICWLILVITSMEVGLLNGYGTGAPPFSCKTMTPGHSSTPQTTPSPYTISPLSARTVNRRVRVQISAPYPNYFTGYLIQARSAETDEITGTFVDVPEDASLLNCGSEKGSAVTHRTNSTKQSVEVEWMASPNYKGSIAFVATLVYNYSTYWVAVRSLPVEVIDGTSAKSPALTEEAQALNAAVSSTYAGCGVTRNCVGSPENCIENRNCVALVAVSPAEGKYRFEMFAKNNSAYVSFGLSDDALMGGDNVVECVFEDEIRPHRSWNLPNQKHNNRITDETGEVIGVSLENGLSLEGIIYCSVKMDPVTYVQGTKFDLNNDQFYLLLAAGSESDSTNIGYHDIARASSRDRRQLSDLQPVKKANDPFYDGCDVSKNCFGSPEGCIETQNCRAVTSVTVKGTNYIFQMQASNVAYVATAFSLDKSMGGDSVFECLIEQQRVVAYASWNPPGVKANRRIKEQEYVRFINGSFVDGVIQCTVSHEAKFTVEGESFDLMKNKYVLLLAAGSSVKGNGSIDYHDVLFTASAEPRALSDVGAFKAASKLLIHLHGSFMVAAWIGTTSLGIVLARYYRQTWVGRQLCGKDVWFAWHRFFMAITWILTIAGVVIIYLDVGGFVSGPSETHALLGIITTILAFVQPIGATFRPHPDSSRRPIFNWLHWFIGNASHIVAIVTLFLAVDLNKAELPKWTDWILAAYVAFYVLIHLILSVFSCLSEKSGAIRINTIPMKDMHSTRNPAQYEHKKDTAYSGFRKFIIAIHVLLISAFSVVLILLVIYSPIK